ncbi:hypothetical protein ABPG75_011695 [Micractinium tetrahymenae]
MFATATSPALAAGSRANKQLRQSDRTPRRQAVRAPPPRAAAAVGAPQGGDAGDAVPLSRRQLLAIGTAILAGGAVSTGTAGGLAAPLPAQALELAPLGPVQAVGEKLEGLSAEQVKDILARNLREGQYFVTGDLTPEIFDDDCVFRDPTNETRGLSRYMKALGILFDASYSAVQLKDIRVTGPRTIEADWLLGGYLKLPWHPRVEAFQGHTVYRLNDRGLIELQDQTWSIDSFTALAESFTPTPGVKSDIKERLRSA